MYDLGWNVIITISDRDGNKPKGFWNVYPRFDVAEKRTATLT